MKVLINSIFLVLMVTQNLSAYQFFNIFSPDNKVQLNLQLSKEGSISYSLFMDTKVLIKKGQLGLKLAEGISFDEGFEIQKIDTLSISKKWEPVWGEEKTIEENSMSMLVTLKQAKADNRIFQIEFRLSNDGLGFRYIFPSQKGLYNFIITDELTSFPLTGNHKAFWIPGDYDTNEYIYTNSALSDIHALKEKKENGIAFKWIISDSAVQTPLTMKTKEGLYMSIHEAALVNYPAMNLEVNRNNYNLKAHLVPDCNGNKAYLHAGSKSPWRVILLARKASSLLTNRIILNLNEPSKIKNTDFIKPGKFIGVWWELHIGKSSWDYSGQWGWEIPYEELKPSGKHGATTENVIKYIDFASKNKIPYVLVEGWNLGWEDWFGSWKEHVFHFSKPYPDFDIDKISQYAKSKNVKMIMHHETSSAVTDYERQMDSAFLFMKKYNYGGIKSGYVGKIIPRGEHHDGQWMINHYIRVAEKCAHYEFMLDAHEPVRPTGLHRTYPNWMACEAARGNEFNAWSVGNPPDHETILPFTRLLGGPMDYTPGIFQIKMNAYDPKKTEQVHTTLSKQLALYVTLYSPFQMAADLPENYEKYADAFQFIKDVPTDWDSTIVLDAEPGDYIYLARKEKNSINWFIGAITDEKARDYTIAFDFLQANKKYLATIYRDSETADWEKNPMDYKIDQKKINKKDKLKIHLAPGGGCAISIKEIIE
ncbi:MAG: glycoside hydrolase family 97 protein [Saprospiraceae bacterium]|nr:glycoside hydrolase family 97 protein [Saprospiraceae bacterium]